MKDNCGFVFVLITCFFNVGGNINVSDYGEVSVVDDLSGLINSYAGYAVNFHFDSNGSFLVNRLIKSVDTGSTEGVILMNYDKDIELLRTRRKAMLNVAILDDPLRFGSFIENPNNSKTLDVVLFVLQNTTREDTMQVAGLNLFGTVLIATIDRNLSLYKLCYFCGSLTGKILPWSNTSQELKPRRFANFFGHTLKVAFIDYFPVVWCEKTGADIVLDSTTYKVCSVVKGSEFELLSTIASKLNFSVVAIRRDEDYVGLINQTGHGVFDVAMGGITLTFDRAQFATFTHIYWFESYNAMFFKQSFSWRHLVSFLDPLQTELWICIVSACFLSAAVFDVIGKFETHKRRCSISLLDIFWECMRLFVDQQIPSNKISKIRRRSLILLTAWCIVSLNTSTAYKSKLLSTLLNPPVKEPEKFLDLIKDGYSVVTNSGYGDVVEGLLRYAKVNKGYDSVLKNPVLLDTVCGEFAYVATHRAATIDEYTSLQYEIRSTCKKEMKDYEKLLDNIRILRSLKMFGHAWVLQKGVPFDDIFNRIINRIVRAGLIQKWRQDATRTMDINEQFFPYSNAKKSLEKRIDVGLETLMSPFFVYLCGNAIAVLVFLLEIVVYYKPFNK